MTDPIYPIGVVAKLLGVSDHTIRMYEREGLVLSVRTESGHRRYSENDVEKLRCIRRMIVEKGLNLEGIKRLCSLIPCWGINPECNVSDYKKCDAFNQVGIPCWALDQKSDPCHNQDCYTCEVYRTHFDCSNIKELIYDRHYLWKMFELMHT